MKALIQVNNAAHQKQHVAAILECFLAHGIMSECVPRGTISEHRDQDFTVMWGWKPAELIRHLKHIGQNILCMERGYLPDRFLFTSLGWNGLNNRATFPDCKDNGERFRKYWPDLLKPWRTDGGEYALLCGQVPGDASLYGRNFPGWAQAVTDTIRAHGDRVLFRPHPLVKRQKCVTLPKGAELSQSDDLQEDLAKAKYCVTYNSNSGVESVCAGVPTITMDEGAMAWPVTSHAIGEPLITPDRTEWVHRLAWCNWTMEEIRNGQAWSVIKEQLK